MTWLVDDFYHAHIEALRDLRAAYNGGPQPPWDPTELTPDEWAAGRPDHLAPFWCRCGLVFHVRRHHDTHTCGAAA